MAPLDSLPLPDVSESATAGENLENDAEFGALERAAKGKAEVQYGDTVEEAVPPDWKEAEAIAESLMARTLDLRVLVHLAIARLNLHGIPAYAQVVTAIRELLDTRWEQVHPQLEPEDDLDPMQRANALVRLQDPLTVQRPMRDLPLAAFRGDRVSWRDIAVFNGAMEPEVGQEKPTEAKLRGIFAKTDRERLGGLAAGVDLAVRETAALCASFDRKAGAGNAPDLGNVSKLLKNIQRELQRFEPPAEAAPAEAEAEAVAPEAGAAPQAAVRAVQTIRSIVEVSRREDALHALELASGYFRAYEPSSPLPMLIDRARRLAVMDFMDILRDLAPDGLSQAQIVAGPPQE